MQTVGHKMEAIYRRYATVNQADVHVAAVKQAALDRRDNAGIIPWTTELLACTPQWAIVETLSAVAAAIDSPSQEPGYSVSKAGASNTLDIVRTAVRTTVKLSRLLPATSEHRMPAFLL
jgi:hypothetical protein